ncbi:MAG: type II secretion system secretin GspD, partial [Desulfobacterales bacterium]
GMMKRSIERKLFLFFAVLLTIIFGLGCAVQKPLAKGEDELISTPFGDVKRLIEEPGKKAKAHVPAQEPAAPPAEVFTPPLVTSPVSEAEPAKPAPILPDKPKEKEVAEKAGQIEFNFDDADIYEVIRTIAELLNINYIVDPNVKGKVTIHTAGGLRKEDLLPVFFQILEVNGLTAIKEGNLHKIVQIKDAPRMLITSRFGYKGEDVPPGEKIIIQIIPLQFISAQEMTKLLTPFISAGGTILSHKDSNTLLVVDKGLNILKIMRLVEAFDVNVFEKFNHRFYYLEYLDAEEIAETFTNIVATYGDVAKDIVNVIAIKRLNALLVISSNSQVFEKVEVFIRQLDVPSEEVDPRIYVYSVKNGEAEDLGSLLNQVFADKPSAKKKGAKDQTKKKAEAAPNPLSRKTKEAKAEKAPETQKESRQPVASGKMETTGSGTLRGEINITADEIRNALIIEAIPADYRVIENILKQIDVLPRQVLIEVTIAEISLNKSTELGIEWSYWKGPGNLSTSLLDASLGISGFTYTIGMTDRWTSALKALATEGKVNILSSPHILASDNKEAKIDVSSEIPLASAEYKYSAETDVTETTIEYRDTGVILSVTPHINERGLVSMDINQEVSEQGDKIEVAGKKYPSFDKRIIQTTLTVKHGQSIVIGGLIKDKKTEDVAGAPCLINIPVLRYLTGTESERTEKTELIILITPYVIVSLDDVDAVTQDFKSKVGSVMKKFEK